MGCVCVCVWVVDTALTSHVRTFIPVSVTLQLIKRRLCQRLIEL